MLPKARKPGVQTPVRAWFRCLVTGIFWVGASVQAKGSGQGQGDALNVASATQELMTLESRLKALSAEFRPEAEKPGDVAQRRMIDAQQWFELKNYRDAATVLMDVVDNHKDTRNYPEALFLLGECLYLSGEMQAARPYFQEAARQPQPQARTQSILQRLVEIALKTKNLVGIDQVMVQLEQVSADLADPSIYYVRGKYLFFKQDLAGALAAFTKVPMGAPYYLQAKYFIGTTQVSQGELAAAAATFDNILQTEPVGDADREVQDLARLAIGRIHFEREEFQQARAAYGTVDRDSKYFVEALYESAWSAIREGTYDKAFRALDLMLLQDPDSGRGPELQILMGNLNLRMEKFYVALNAFETGLKAYEPILNEVRQTLVKVNTDAAYLETVTGKGFEAFDVSRLVPEKAARWVRNDKDVARVLLLADEIGTLRQGLDEAERLLVRLDAAVNGEGKVGIFRDLAKIRASTSEILNHTVQIRQRYLAALHQLIDPKLNATEIEMLERITAARQAIQNRLSQLPTSGQDVASRDKAASASVADLLAALSETNVRIQGLDAELVAIEQYHQRSQALAGGQPGADAPLGDVLGPVGDLKKEVEAMRAQSLDFVEQAGVCPENCPSQARRGRKSGRRSLFCPMPCVKSKPRFPGPAPVLTRGTRPLLTHTPVSPTTRIWWRKGSSI